MQNNANNYGISITDAPTLKTKFAALIERLARKNRVVILIDEYDYPLINNINNLKLAEECRQILHDFFIVLKDLNRFIRFIFITGVTKFAKTSIFSGLNSLNDITFHPKAAQLLGYTETEIKQYLDPYLKSFGEKENCSIETVISSLRQWYDGYHFVEEQSHAKETNIGVYNPFSVLLALDNQKILNYWSASGTPSFLAHLIKTQDYPLAEIDGAEVHYLDTKSYELDKMKLLLWQTGYLTIQSYDSRTQNYKLTHPNREIKDSFFSFFLSNLTSTDISDITRTVERAKQAMLKNDYDQFFKELQIFFANIPHPPIL